MRSTTFYKPSNKFSPLGTVLLAVAVFVVGLVLSWVYLALNRIIPVAQICIIMPFLFSFALGGIGSIFVKKFKIRSPIAAVIALLIALLFVNYFKWAMYVAKDFDKNKYKTMRETDAIEYYGLEEVSDYFTAEEYMTLCKLTPASILRNDYTQKELDYLSDDEIDLMDNGSIWEFFEYDDILGTKAEEVEKSLEKAADMNAYEFTYEYRGLTVKTMGYLATHPGEMFKDIKNINKGGRWYLGRSYNEDANNNIKGAMLWIVWVVEFIFLTAPALMLIRGAASAPFIEDDDNWAIEENTEEMFRFEDASTDNMGGSEEVKKNLLQTPDYIFTLAPITKLDPPPRYYSLTYCHSRYFDDNYITVKNIAAVPNKKGKYNTSVLVEYVSVDADYIATLYGIFKKEAPAMCKGVDRHEDLEDVRVPTNVKSAGYEAIFNRSVEEVLAPGGRAPDTEPVVQKEEAAEESSKEEKVYIDNSGTTGMMEGVDTSKLKIEPPKPTAADMMFNKPADDSGSASSGDMDGLDTSNLKIDFNDLK